MEAKYFTAESKETAEAAALTYFACGKEEVVFDTISGEEDGPWQILAIKGAPGEADNMDATYGLYYEEDGVYLELYAERGKGEPLDSHDVMHHLVRKNIVNLSVPAVQTLAGTGYGRSKIAMCQQEHIYGEDIKVIITGDELEASARLLAPEPGGPVLDLNAAKQKLIEEGVIHGVDESALVELLEAKDYGEPRVVARATPPDDGADGKLIFHFSLDERTGTPREIGGGRVDYRSLDLYVPVTEGQLLVTKTAATEGSLGTSVRGMSIKQRSGKDISLPRGKNVEVNDDKTEMHSVCAGMVEFVNNTVVVSNVYKIDGDCDMSVGNVDFDGSVQITGSVRSGHTITATAGIIVSGGVEAATLIAGGNVEVKGGMQGSSKGRIEAGGSVNIQYIERGTVIADGPVTVDVSIHSTIETETTLHAVGKRGAIIGGQTRVAGDIVASYIGALSNTRTDVEVGVMPKKRNRILAIEKEMERIAADKIKLDQLDTYLSTSKATMDPATWEKLTRSGMENRRINEEDMEAYTAEINELRDDLEHATESKVHVFETVFAGSRIMIGTDVHKVENEISYVTFKYNDGQVVYGSCELSKGDK